MKSMQLTDLAVAGRSLLEVTKPRGDYKFALIADSFNNTPYCPLTKIVVDPGFPPSSAGRATRLPGFGGLLSVPTANATK